MMWDCDDRTQHLAAILEPPPHWQLALGIQLQQPGWMGMDHCTNTGCSSIQLEVKHRLGTGRGRNDIRLEFDLNQILRPQVYELGPGRGHQAGILPEANREISLAYPNQSGVRETPSDLDE
jgi:hypothetical protein